MATKGKTPKHPQAHKGIRNMERPNGKSWKKSPRARMERIMQQEIHNRKSR